jgi:hypothetical protein
MDIRLFKTTGTYEDDDSEILQSAILSDTPANDLETIANKVVKFLLTYIGTDLIEPEYGGRAFHIKQISKQYLPRFYLELQQDISRCITYIHDVEKDLDDTLEKLESINIKNIYYNSSLSPTRLDVYLEIITNFNTRTVVTLQTGSATI